ncbi:interferon_alpha-inducible protein [Hexamita inflata]|uniref:Interferon alpha-inducible protein n=1 Tax=Hexamita inflata TaxID=28002 RepID=A0AA86P4A9_9EUKA|nr:interferon alpha-inducible protein [Hexamita inflata]
MIILSMIGFKTLGIAAGSAAAKMMAAAAIANGGGVAAGSMVAILQTMGTMGVLSAIEGGVLSGGAIYAAYKQFQKTNPEKSNNMWNFDSTYRLQPPLNQTYMEIINQKIEQAKQFTNERIIPQISAIKNDTQQFIADKGRIVKEKANVAIDYTKEHIIPDVIDKAHIIANYTSKTSKNIANNVQKFYQNQFQSKDKLVESNKMLSEELNEMKYQNEQLKNENLELYEEVLKLRKAMQNTNNNMNDIV